MGPLTAFLLKLLHLDVYLNEIITQYGVWTYSILFVIIFCETGLVVTPFLPGDSLLFVTGSLAASENSTLNPWLLVLVLSIAAILGDTVNYWMGHYIGPKAFTDKSRFLKKEYLERTHRFYEKYGGKTIVLARFVPIVRTFAPFVAGIGAMNYTKFIIYNVVGGIVWVTAFIFAGYYLSSYLQNNKLLMPSIVLAIIVVSVMPMVIEYWRARREAKQDKAEGGEGKGD